MPAPQTKPVPGQRNALRYAAVQEDDVGTDARADFWLNSPAIDPLTSDPTAPEPRRLRLDIPTRLPGAEAPAIDIPPSEDRVARAEEIDRVYGELPPMPLEPRPSPGPDGRPYTLTELQRIAAANSPDLRQAAADVQGAYGVMVQARTYANPQGSYFVDPNANNTSSGVQGVGIEQVIKTAGKQKLSAAAARMDYDNAVLALRRARNDLATQVRQAYFALLVDKETLEVTRAVAHFTDEIYRLQTGMLKGTLAAPYEPTALRAQAFTTRLAYQQAIANYIFDWKSLVATLGMRQLPLTQVGGRIDRFIPYYDYDDVLAYALRNHTDILTARNLVPQARYKLRLAQVTPIPDLDVGYRYGKDFTAFPFGSYSQLLLQMPMPVWDQNKGNIMAAQAALIRATEEQHSAEINLTNNLADAYTNYKNSLYAIDYYRRFILPDLVRYYRGVYTRRPLQPEEVNVGDLAFAQQTLSQGVTAYLGYLGNMWQSVVAVAAFLQTDDLFQMATPRPLPELPDFDELSRWACGHSTIAAPGGVEMNGQPIAAGPMARRPNAAPTPPGGDLPRRAANNAPLSDTRPITPPSPRGGATVASRRNRGGQQDDR
jgi:cobalt-zinc-cadmium efflux system outer membrane protein